MTAPANNDAALVQRLLERADVSDNGAMLVEGDDPDLAADMRDDVALFREAADRLAAAAERADEADRWLAWSGGEYPDTSPGDVIAAEADGTIVLDDAITTWNPLRANEFLAAALLAAQQEREEVRQYAADCLTLAEKRKKWLERAEATITRLRALIDTVDAEETWEIVGPRIADVLAQDAEQEAA